MGQAESVPPSSAFVWRCDVDHAGNFFRYIDTIALHILSVHAHMKNHQQRRSNETNPAFSGWGVGRCRPDHDGRARVGRNLRAGFRVQARDLRQWRLNAASTVPTEPPNAGCQAGPTFCRKHRLRDGDRPISKQRQGLRQCT